MLSNYLKIAFRNIKKYKSYSAIIFASLILSLTVFFLIAAYVLYELSYDRFFESSDRIYRVSLERKYPKLVRDFAFIGPGVGPSIKSDLPGVDEFVRIQKREGIIKHDNKVFKQENILCVDSTFLNVFSLKLVHRNSTNILNTPLSSVISVSFSNKLFGDESPLGKVVTMNDSINIYITGVAEDLPSNSHFHFDLLVSSFPEWNEARAPLTSWGWFGFNTYLLLNKKTSYKELDSKLNKLTSKYLRSEFGGDDYDEWIKNQNYYRFYLTPLTDIHLHSNMTGELGINGNIEKVYFFSVIALFVLFIGCANFVNMITARFSTRAKEVGVRKVLGSSKGNLIIQFMGESLLMVSLSVLISLYLVSIFIAIFNANLHKQIELSSLVSPIMVISLFVFALVLGIISGFYPALFLSSFNPISIFKGKISSGLKTSHIRNILVVAQFSLTIILIVGTVLVYDQLEYVMNKEIGFDKENIVTISNSNILQSSKETFKREILKDNNIGYGSYSTGLPSFVDNPATYRLSTANENDNINIQTIWADNDFLQTFGLNITTGRDFIPNDLIGGQHVAIINEAAANKLGWEKEAIGKEIHIIDNTRLTIEGISNDFNFESLHRKIEPLVIIATDPATIQTNFFSAKISGNNIRKTLEFIENKWNKFTSGADFEYNFLDERIASLYENEQQTLKLFLSFSVISILVACLGLFGLVSFAIEQRTKEIGIRKILGATVSNIMLSLSKNFVGLVLIANIISWPVAYYMMSLWLQDFAYRISISWLIFVFAGSLSFVIALLTVSTQAIRAALANPVESLRYE
jgi:putative ABC transport system permease protein